MMEEMSVVYETGLHMLDWNLVEAKTRIQNHVETIQ